MNITVCHKPQTLLQWSMGEYTQSPAFFNIASLPSLHYIITINPDPPAKSSNHYSISSRHVKYWLTSRHIGNFLDVPLIEVSVEV
jgi:hypothetical protein